MMTRQWLEYAVSASMVVAFLLLMKATGWTFAEALLFAAVAYFGLLVLLLAWCGIVFILDKYRER